MATTSALILDSFDDNIQGSVDIVFLIFIFVNLNAQLLLPWDPPLITVCLRSQSAARASVFCRLGFHHRGTSFTCIHINPC